MNGKPASNGARPAPRVPQKTVWKLRLYVVDQTPRCLAAYGKLKAICEERLAGKYHIEVVDLLDHPECAHHDQILATPTVVRRFPGPARRVIGDLSNVERVMACLGMEASAGEA